MIYSYMHNQFNTEYIPTVSDVYKGTKNLYDTQVELEIHDTGGDEAYTANGKITYQDADVFIICASTNSTDSFDHIEAWRDMIQSVEPDKPIMLILTQIDLLNSVEEKVDYQQMVNKCK